MNYDCFQHYITHTVTSFDINRRKVLHDLCPLLPEKYLLQKKKKEKTLNPTQPMVAADALAIPSCRIFSSTSTTMRRVRSAAST